MVLPYNEGKSFDKEAHKSQFYIFLQTLYRQTKDLMVDKNICKKVIVSKLEASTQIGKMKILENSIKKFIAAVEQLLRPYVAEAAGEQPHLLSIMGPQTAKAPNVLRNSIKNLSKSFKQPAPPKTAPIPAKEIKKQSAIPYRVIHKLRAALSPAHKTISETVQKTFVGGGDQQSKDLKSSLKISQAVKKISNSFCQGKFLIFHRFFNKI